MKEACLEEGRGKKGGREEEKGGENREAEMGLSEVVKEERISHY